MNHIQHLPTAEHIVTTTSYVASGTAVFLGLTVDEWGIAAAIIGIIGVAATFAFNAWFKMKYQRRS
jgi:hypothetical protein